MNGSDILVVLIAAILTALLGFYFFGPKKRQAAVVVKEGVQTVTITVKGGYSPDVIKSFEVFPSASCLTGRSRVTARPESYSRTSRSTRDCPRMR